MKLKASIDYGVRAIVYLAIKGTTCSSKEISEKMDVPRDYLIQLGLRLRDCGLIQARPGKNGGYVLSKSPSEITVKQIFNAFDSNQRGLRHPLKGSKNDAEMVGKIMQSYRLEFERLSREHYGTGPDRRRGRGRCGGGFHRRCLRSGGRTPRLDCDCAT